MWANLSIPVRAQLGALVFEKSMRRKDVKGVKKKREDGDSTEGVSENGKKGSEMGQDEDEGDALQKSKQSTINLVGVDAKRVADFCCYNNFIPGSVFKLIISLVFLANLLGVKALLCGFSTMLLLVPINIHVSKRYAAVQDRLMKVRDQKMAVVTEALQGIRQIKFAALEPQWEKKINAIRERELKSVWDVFMNDVVLITLWVSSPVILATASLTFHAIIEGTLTPSVAFGMSSSFFNVCARKNS